MPTIHPEPFHTADVALLRLLEAEADRIAGGQLTILRFGTDWHVGFGVPASPAATDQTLAAGKSFDQAASLALVNARRRAAADPARSGQARGLPARTGVAHPRSEQVIAPAPGWPRPRVAAD